MRNDKIIPGLVLVLIGAAFLLHNFGILHFHLSNIWHLWPIFLVIGGINLVFAHNRSPWATILKISVAIVGVGLVLFGNFGTRYNFWPSTFYFNDGSNKWDDSNDSGSIKTTGKGDFNEPYSADAKVARLNISGGGTSYNLSDTTNQLFTAVTMDNQSRYTFSQSKDDSTYVLDFKMRSRHGFNFGSQKHEANFRLNAKPEWEINVDAGATSLNFDLSKFKVRELTLHGGAAEFNVKLGAPLAMTDVDVSTGFADVTVNIPQNTACSIEANSGLSDSNIEGINKVSDNHWETPGYDAAKTKIHIHISGGLSDFKVRRY